MSLTSIGSGAVDAVGNFINGVVEAVSIEASKLVRMAHGKTLSSTSIKAAIKIRFPFVTGRSVMMQAVDRADRVVRAYLTSKGDDRPKTITTKTGQTRAAPIRSSKRLDLGLDVSLVRRLMRRYSTVERVSENAAVYLTAAVDTIIREILADITEQLRKDKKTQQRISERHVAQELANDNELRSIARL